MATRSYNYPKETEKRRYRLLVVHFGDAQMRGSERCILNLIKGATQHEAEIILWSNHSLLNDAAHEYTTATIKDGFYAPFGFNASPSDKNPGVVLIDWIKEARRIFDIYKPNLVLCNSLAPCQWMLPASFLNKIPLVVYLHTDYLPKTRLLSLAYGATHIIGVSNFSLQNFKNDGVNERQLSVIYNGVEDISFHVKNANKIREELDIQQDEFVFTSMSALVEWKRVEVIVDAFRLMSQEGHRGAVLLIVGDGPCQQALRTQSAGLRVIFTGWRDDVADIFAVSNVFISAAEREAFCLAILEAASMGLPAIGARAGGVLEVIDDGKTGLFADPGQPQSFAKAMFRLMLDPNLCASLGASARTVFLERYQSERMVTQVYENIKRFTKNDKADSISYFRRLFNLIYLSIRAVFSRIISRQV